MTRKEITMEDVKTYCEKRNLVVLTKELFDEMTNALQYRERMVVRGLEKIPSVQQEPFINKPCVSEQACREDKIKVLGKIKKEIEAKCCITVGRECDGAITLRDIFEIIDKYKSESET